MNKKDRKIIYVSILASVLLHIFGLIVINYQYLLGAAKTEEPPSEPLELVFEQPQPKPEEKIPERFYELVENPNASGNKPEDAGRLSTESSLSQSPVIMPGDLRAVPGSEVEKSKNKQSAAKPETDTKVQEAVKNALLAYHPPSSFSRSALTGAKEVKETEAEEEKQEKGETQRRPKGFSADLVGDFALSTYSWNWAPYWLAFKRKLNRVWFAPPAYSELGLIHGHSIVRFKVTRDGRMYDFSVLRHIGHVSLKQSSINAIQSVFPFNSLPEGFPDEYLEVTIKMIYPDLRQYRAGQ